MGFLSTNIFDLENNLKKIVASVSRSLKSIAFCYISVNVIMFFFFFNKSRKIVVLEKKNRSMFLLIHFGYKF